VLICEALDLIYCSFPPTSVSLRLVPILPLLLTPTIKASPELVATLTMSLARHVRVKRFVLRELFP
jgi:hypothetical protein